MCGIAGVIAWDDRYRVTRETLERMSARIAHRGPDGQGIYINHEQEVTPDRPQVALAHRRLAIIDLDPRANQPFTDGQGRWIVFNGEIYNYRELRKELEGLRPGYAWRTTCDTEVLLAAYAAWGNKCVERLNGMFAFAIWDENSKSVFLARDRMGVKPLYIAVQPEGMEHTFGLMLALVDADHCMAESHPLDNQAVAFASELPALLEVPWVKPLVDQESIREYLECGYVPTQRTIYETIGQLRPGQQMRVCHINRKLEWQDMEEVQHNCYRDPDNCDYFNLAHITFDRQWKDSPLDDTTAVRRTRDLVLDAIRRRLISDVPLGCFLSGGIDSSVVAAAMKACVPPDQPVMTFSIGFDDPRYDEREPAQAVARHLKTEHRDFVVRPDAAQDLPRIASAFGEPFGDSSALPTYYLSRETRKFVTVALSGDGGDEMFAGYDRYRAMMYAQKLQRSFPAEVRWLISIVGKVLPESHPKSSLARFKRFAASIKDAPEERYASYMRLFAPILVRQVIQPEFFRETKWRGRAPVRGFAGRTVLGQAMAADRTDYLPGDLLAKVDRCSMLHALEVRSPFLDVDLVKFAVGLTDDQLLRGGKKRMLREAFAADLPEFVFKRKKMGFAVPIGEWFRGELRPMLHDLLFSADSFASGHFNRPVVQRLVDEHEQFKVDHSQRLYALLMLELWWRTSRVSAATV